MGAKLPRNLTVKPLNLGAQRTKFVRIPLDRALGKSKRIPDSIESGANRVVVCRSGKVHRKA